MKYLVIQNRETNGPFTIGQLRSMWNSGAITGNTLYSKDGSDDWSTLEDLAAELEQTQQSSPPLPTPPPPLADNYASAVPARNDIIQLDVDRKPPPADEALA